MAEYIDVDTNGKELKREKKGRGRPRKGYEQGSDGNWYREVPSSPVATQEKQHNTTDENDQDDEDDESSKTDRIPSTRKKVKADRQISVDELLRSLFFRGEDCVIRGTKVYIRRPDIRKEYVVKGIESFASYAKMEIDTRSGDINIWNMDKEKPDPDRIVIGAINTDKPWES